MVTERPTQRQGNEALVEYNAAKQRRRGGNMAGDVTAYGRRQTGVAHPSSCSILGLEITVVRVSKKRREEEVGAVVNVRMSPERSRAVGGHRRSGGSEEEVTNSSS